MFISNRTNKIKSYSQKDDTDSDHSILQINRQMKINASEQQYILTSPINKMDNKFIVSEILSHDDYITCLTSKNHNIVTELLIKIINETIGKICPTKKSE